MFTVVTPWSFVWSKGFAVFFRPKDLEGFEASVDCGGNAVQLSLPITEIFENVRSLTRSTKVE